MKYKMKCTWCQSDRIKLTKELEYNEDVDKDVMGNKLITVEYRECAVCGNDEWLMSNELKEEYKPKSI